MKQILDPEIPPRDFRIDSSGSRVDTTGCTQVANIFCENALETALQVRDRLEAGEVTVLTVGSVETEEMLRKALAMKADHAVRVDHEVSNPVATVGLAKILGAAVQQLGGFDLILLGRESGDWGFGQTGAILAEVLNLPLVSFVDQIETQETGLRLHRQTDEGWELFSSATPVVATITNSDGNLPRIPKTRDIMKSARKEVTVLGLNDLNLEGDASAGGCQVMSLSLPEPAGSCEFVEGDSLDERVDRFADRVAEIVRAL